MTAKSSNLKEQSTDNMAESEQEIDAVEDKIEDVAEAIDDGDIDKAASILERVEEWLSNQSTNSSKMQNDLSKRLEKIETVIAHLAEKLSSNEQKASEQTLANSSDQSSERQSEAPEKEQHSEQPQTAENISETKADKSSEIKTEAPEKSGAEKQDQSGSRKKRMKI